uniref:FA_desaturase domain-containing protein n=1 Tax=Heligmosomoides polygyrus TaxID=6339 RepID=A0A183F9B4_HELPZ
LKVATMSEGKCGEFQDLVILAVLYAVLPSVEHYLGLAGYLAWCWVFGIFACGLFVIGHDCGHGSFSEYEWVNDVCGHIAHASVLTPFWPWQKSHRQHHQYTSHVEKDKGHPWMKEHDFQKQSAVAKYFGWFPLAGWIRLALSLHSCNFRASTTLHMRS